MAKNVFKDIIKDAAANAEDVQSAGEIVEELRNNTAALQSTNEAIKDTKKSVEDAVTKVDGFVERIEGVPDKVRDALTVTIPPETIDSLNNTFLAMKVVFRMELESARKDALTLFKNTLEDESTTHAASIDKTYTDIRDKIGEYELSWSAHEKNMATYRTEMLKAANRLQQLDNRVTLPVLVSLLVFLNLLFLFGYAIITIIGSFDGWSNADFRQMAWWGIGGLVSMNAFICGIWYWQEHSNKR